MLNVPYFVPKKRIEYILYLIDITNLSGFILYIDFHPQTETSRCSFKFKIQDVTALTEPKDSMQNSLSSNFQVWSLNRLLYNTRKPAPHNFQLTQFGPGIYTPQHNKIHHTFRRFCFLQWGLKKDTYSSWDVFFFSSCLLQVSC